jgi:DNA-binding transcriptional LysR family regulator
LHQNRRAHLAGSAHDGGRLTRILGGPAVTEQDLTTHRCVNLCLPTHGKLYAWDFEEGKSVNVRVQGQMVFNNTVLMLQAALDGMGFAYLPFDHMRPHIDAGRLVPVLEDWWQASLSGLSPVLREPAPDRADLGAHHRCAQVSRTCSDD